MTTDTQAYRDLEFSLRHPWKHILASIVIWPLGALVFVILIVLKLFGRLPDDWRAR